jgi:putative hydrolase of the HAD superfamily
MIRTIFLDFGKVLAWFDHELAVTRLLPHADSEEELLHRALYHSERFNALESGQIEPAEYIRQVRSEVPLRCSNEFFCEVFGDIFTPIGEMCALVPKLAQRYRLVLASNTNEIHARNFVPAYKATFDHFQKLVLSHEAKARKPDADFYWHCQQFALCEPGECLFVDDREDNIAAGARQGWQTIQFHGYAHLLRELARRDVYNDGNEQ